MRIALYLPDLSGGGIERLHVGLARHWLDAGHEIEFVLNARRGELLDSIPADARIIDLNVRRQAAAVPALMRYLRASRPDIAMAGHDHNNIALAAAGLATPGATRIVASQHNSLTGSDTRGLKFLPVPLLYRALLPRLDALVAVSEGVADDLAAVCRVPRTQVHTIHNGIVPDDLAARMAEPIDDTLFSEGRPTIVGMGRMVEQKDFATLLDAFALLRRHIDARLLILGDGPLRPALTARAEALGVAADVAMPGFVTTPLAHLARASLFVLSSRHEGFGNVVAEALACGTPVVSTDCPHGPREILAEGRHGTLVPVGDASAMAGAVVDGLSREWDRDALAARGQDFSERSCARRYLDLFETIAGTGRSIQNRLVA